MLSDQLGLLIASHLGPDALSIVDLRREETRRLDLDVSPEQLAISPAGDLVAISNAQDDAVILLAPRGERALRRIDAPGAPGDLVVDRTGELLLVASTAAAEVALIDVAAARVVQRIALDGEAGADPDGVRALARTPGGKLGFALHGEIGKVSVIGLWSSAGTPTRRWFSTAPTPAARHDRAAGAAGDRRQRRRWHEALRGALRQRSAGGHRGAPPDGDD